MLDDAFAESLVHRRAPWYARLRGLTGHRVLGQRLRPLCFWHQFGLDVIGSPFGAAAPSPSAPPGLTQLAAAVTVCRSAWPEFQRPAARFSLLRACLLNFRFGPRYLAEFRRFLAYLRDYEQPPVFGTTPGGSDPLKTPWYQVCVMQLMRAGLTEREAWMTPVGQGLWMIAAAAEARGEKVQIETAADRAAQAEAAGGSPDGR